MKAEKAEAKTIDFEHIKAAIYEKLPAGKKLLDDFCTLHAALTGNLPVKAAVESKKPKQESNRKTAAKRLRTMGPGTASSDQST